MEFVSSTTCDCVKFPTIVDKNYGLMRIIKNHLETNALWGCEIVIIKCKITATEIFMEELGH